MDTRGRAIAIAWLQNGAARRLRSDATAGDGVYGPPRDRDEALAVLRAALDAGVDHIDTAQYYGPA